MDETVVSAGEQIVDTAVGSFTTAASGIADTVSTVFSKMFISPTGGISDLAIWGLVLLGIGAAFGLVKMFTNKLG